MAFLGDKTPAFILIVGCISLLTLGISQFYIDDPFVLITAVVAVIALLALGLASIKFLFYAWIVTLPFAQWSLYDLGFANLYVDRVLLVYLLVLCLVYGLNRKIFFPRPSRVEFLMLVFIVVGLVSAAKSHSLDRFGFGGILSAYILPIIAYYLAKTFLRSETDVRTFSVVVTYALLYLSYVGICEQLFPSLVFPSYIADPQYIISNVGRSVGPSLEPVGYGTGLVFCWLFAVYLFCKTESFRSLHNILAFVAILIAPIAMFFTYTRAVWGELVIALGILFVLYPRGKKLFGGLLAIGLVGFTLIQALPLSKTEGSAEDVVERNTIYVRISLAEAGLRMFWEKPVFGVGYLQASKEFSPYFEPVGSSYVPDPGTLMHNTFVNVLVELGIIGFIPFACIFFCLIRDGIASYRQSLEDREITILFLAACAAFMFAALANNMYYPFSQVLLFSMAGMVRARLRTQAANLTGTETLGYSAA
jgi:O-antigen ligase